MSKWSNCHFEAWKQFRAEEAEYMCIRFTQFSKMNWMGAWWWTPLRCLGSAIQWVAWPMTHVGELLRSGRWYHATWICWDSEHWEFIPLEHKQRRYVPPLIFKGLTEKVRK